MKNIFLNIRTAALATCMGLVLALVVTSCQEDEIGAPQIFGMRLTNPAAADSIFTASELGQTVVILGRNLATTRQVFFNDVEAYLNPNLIRDDNIILTVPASVPGELNNLITVVTAVGIATHPFQVEIPGPVISYVSLEMVVPGDIITVQGNYFFSSEVTIGGVQAEVVAETQEKLEIRVAEGTIGGPLTIKTLFGENTYPYAINDKGSMLLDWEDDGQMDCWRKLRVFRPGDASKPVPMITGNYGHVSDNNMGQTYWFDPGVITTCGSTGVTGNLAQKALKMEINIPEPIKTGYYRLWFNYSWEYRLSLWKDAPFKSDGWITVTIPLSEFKNSGVSLSNPNDLADLWFVFINESAEMVNEVFHWNIDNVRIVDMLN
jgi:hypothetical protein